MELLGTSESGLRGMGLKSRHGGMRADEVREQSTGTVQVPDQAVQRGCEGAHLARASGVEWFCVYHQPATVFPAVVKCSECLLNVER